MFPVLQIGPLALQTPGLILLIGLWIGIELSERQAAQYQLNPNKIFTLVLVCIGGGLVGGRLVFAASNPTIFYENPLNLFSLSTQMISLAGGLAFAVFAGLAFGQRAGLPFWSSLDCLTAWLAVLLISGNLANFASGDAYGLPTNLPWAIYLWGVTRHPAQLYETLAALLAALITWPWKTSKLFEPLKQTGMRFLVFIALASASRLFLEAFRADSLLILGQFRQAQLIAWFGLAISLWQIARRYTPVPVNTSSSNPV